MPKLIKSCCLACDPMELDTCWPNLVQTPEEVEILAEKAIYCPNFTLAPAGARLYDTQSEQACFECGHFDLCWPLSLIKEAGWHPIEFMRTTCEKWLDGRPSAVEARSLV